MHTHIRLFFTILSCLFLASYSFAQEDEIYDEELQDSLVTEDNNNGKKTRKDKKMSEKKELNLNNMFIGSGVGLSFWGNQFRFDLSPYVGYRIGDILAPGLGVTYTYQHTQSNSTFNVFGPKVLLRIRPIREVSTLRNIYLHGEIEFLTLKESSPYYSKPLKGNQTRMNAGFGYTSNFEKGAGFTAEFLFDFYYLYTKTTYFHPFTYRIGFYYGF